MQPADFTIHDPADIEALDAEIAQIVIVELAELIYGQLAGTAILVELVNPVEQGRFGAVAERSIYRRHLEILKGN